MARLNVQIAESGARGHVIGSLIERSQLVESVIWTPGNGGINPNKCRHVSPEDIGGQFQIACADAIDVTVFPSEVALVNGAVDYFEAHGKKAIGPSKTAAQLEASKAFAVEFCHRHDLLIPESRITTKPLKAYDIINEWGVPIVIKADGLAAGKGVTVARSLQQAFLAVDHCFISKKFGTAGDTLVIQRFAPGREVSAVFLTDGKTVRLLPLAQDYKPLREGNNGPNTGGMGSVSPVPWVTPALEQRFIHSAERVIKGMEEEGMPYKGFLYISFMVNDDGVYIIEFNCRPGDPETQTSFLRVESDLVPCLLATRVPGALAELPPLKVSLDARVCVVAVSEGYPENPILGRPIEIGRRYSSDFEFFHAGTRMESGKYFTSGGRVLSIVGRGSTTERARERAYQGLAQVHFEGMYWRRDIGAGEEFLLPAP